MLDFGTVYWKPGSKTSGSPERHFIVILGVDEANKQVWYQTLSSQIKQVFQFPNEKPPIIDVDAVAFLNYKKYSYLDKDTCIMMARGVSKENKAVFEQNVMDNRYKLQGKIIDHNKKSLLLTLKCAAEHFRLTEDERRQIIQHYSATTT